MSTTAGFLLTTLQARIRDTSGTALSTLVPPTTADDNAVGFKILTQAQILINALEEQFYVTTTYALAKQKQFVGPISQDGTLGSVVVRVKGIRQGNADVPFMPLRQLSQIDREWYGREGDRLLGWSMFGKEMLVLYPMLRTSASISVVSVAYTNTLAASGDTIVLSDDMVPQILDVAELIALLRLRHLDRIKLVMQRLQDHYKEELSDDTYMKRMGLMQ